MVFGIAIALGAAELALRLAGPNVPLDLTMARFQAYHPIYGFFHRPGVSGWLRTREFTSFVKFNSQGLRGPEVAIPKPAGQRRVLVMGDSVVEGAQVAESATLAALLPGAMRQAGLGERIESINAGVAGFGQGQQLLYLQRQAARFQPDLVVLVITIANDVADNSVAVARRWKLAADRRPFFVIESNGALRQLDFDAPEPEPLEGPRAVLRDYSVVFNAAEHWWVGKVVARAQGSVVPPLDAEREVYLREPGEDWQQAWQVTERLLVEIQRWCGDAGIPLVLVLAPTQWQVSPAGWREFVGSGSSAERRFGVEVPNERFADMAKRHGIPLVDLLPPFRDESAGQIGTLFFRQDGHWNERGHAVAARELATNIASSKLLTERP